ncbi:MAG: hypothetical protein IPN42_11185 [Methylococcaceae bacterium]|nr:hypothetical protein [Methylococcaceae bacterium]
MKNLLLLFFVMYSATAIAGSRTGHHGDWLVKCHVPKFIQEKPAQDSSVQSFQEFEFVASDNTDAATLKVWVNNKPLIVSIDKRPSGYYRIFGKLPEPLVEGKAWIKVWSESNDGCNDLRAWNVFIK